MRLSSRLPRFLLGIVIIGAVSGITVVATRAFFTDTEQSTGSQFTVGTLDLDVGGANGTNVEPFVIENIGQEGNIAGEKVWVVNNTGSLPGRLYFSLDNVVNNENGCNEPEAIVDTTCDNPGAEQGELGNVVVAKVFLDNVEKASANLTSATSSQIGDTWASSDAMIIPAGGSVEVKMTWATDQDAYGNEIQSDSLSFDTIFDLVQIIEETP